ncbi:CBL-interacting serine/threonine-protein kinase 3-like [Olea europaea var. sylvestris]|uniref:CBL-interacting serine/threonine-protein kinase 3-like n=1 Tax=Olea europaea var. sylvestris TaxID=158386 RepID=UPI000C1D751F|nr:CBL-interacting serine/threonine-protein kinase 3-like [Olea europaea var. sylvestris]
MDFQFKRETRFSSRCLANEIVSKIEEAAEPLGFDVRKKSYKMRLENVKAGRKGNLNIVTEVFQVAPSLHMVEVRKAKGDTLEFHKFYKKLSTSLEEFGKLKMTCRNKISCFTSITKKIRVTLFCGLIKNDVKVQVLHSFVYFVVFRGIFLSRGRI